MSARYALYYAPQSTHPLWRAGCDWLGRDAVSGERTPPAALKTLPILDLVTEAPRRYGFHATIKAPFALTPGITEQDLSVALMRYAGAQRAFRLPALHVAYLEGFLALVPSSPEPELSRVEREVLAQFDAFRAAASEAELRQRRAGLDAEQENLLQRWGYPHVLERFRFHMSLSGSLSQVDERTGSKLAAAARAHFAAALAVPLSFDALCIFEEAEHGADFTLQRRVAFATD